MAYFERAFGFQMMNISVKPKSKMHISSFVSTLLFFCHIFKLCLPKADISAVWQQPKTQQRRNLWAESCYKEELLRCHLIIFDRFMFFIAQTWSTETTKRVDVSLSTLCPYMQLHTLGAAGFLLIRGLVVWPKAHPLCILNFPWAIDVKRVNGYYSQSASNTLHSSLCCKCINVCINGRMLSDRVRLEKRCVSVVC